jgi:hypothetical protein
MTLHAEATSRALVAADPAAAVSGLADSVPYMLAGGAGTGTCSASRGLTPARRSHTTSSADPRTRSPRGPRRSGASTWRWRPRTRRRPRRFAGSSAATRGCSLASSAAALPDLDAAVVAFAPHTAVPGVANNLAAARLGAARVHVATGQDAAARPLLEQVVADLSALPAGTEWLRPYLLAQGAGRARGGARARSGWRSRACHGAARRGRGGVPRRRGPAGEPRRDRGAPLITCAVRRAAIAPPADHGAMGRRCGAADEPCRRSR